MTEVSRATRVRVFMPETVRGLAHPGSGGAHRWTDGGTGPVVQGSGLVVVVSTVGVV